MYNKLEVVYQDYSYTISDEFPNGVYCVNTGNTTSNRTFEVNYNGTYFDVSATFLTLINVGDNVLITVYDSSTATISTHGLTQDGAYLSYYTNISEINGNTIKTNNKIPLNIYNDLEDNGYSYIIRNIHYTEAGIYNFIEYFNVSPFGNLILAEKDNTKIKYSINQDERLKYIDYEGLELTYSLVDGTTVSSTGYSFNTDNQYVNYNLDTFITNIFDPVSPPTNLYSENSISAGEYHIQEIYNTLDSYYPVQSSRFKITPTDITLLSGFKPYTYIDFGLLETQQTTVTYDVYVGNTLTQNTVTLTTITSPYVLSDSGRTMITEVNEDYMIIEKPIDLTVSGITGGAGTVDGIIGIYDLINVAKRVDISDILMKCYYNITDDYYVKKSMSEVSRITGAYGKIISNNTVIQSEATGILYRENDKFNLDIFDIYSTGYVYEDVNLTYYPIEVLDVGIDKKTSTSVSIETKNIIIK